MLLRKSYKISLKKYKRNICTSSPKFPILNKTNDCYLTKDETFSMYSKLQNFRTRFISGFQPSIAFINDKSEMTEVQEWWSLNPSHENRILFIVYRDTMTLSSIAGYQMYKRKNFINDKLVQYTPEIVQGHDKTIKGFENILEDISRRLFISRLLKLGMTFSVFIYFLNVFVY